MNTESHMRLIKIGCCLQLSDAQVVHHLRPLADHPLVREIHIVRDSLPVALKSIPKINHHVVSKFPLAFRFLKMYFICRRLVKEGRIDVIVSFNPIPYGIISWSACVGHHNIPIHFGFIGSDWNGWKQRLSRVIFKPIFHSVELITVPRETMKDNMVSENIQSDRIRLLPHSIDLERFKINDPSSYKYDLIYIGRLIRKKRVDLILKALSELRKKHPEICLCIVGDGSERPTLESMSRDYDLMSCVNFVGYSRDVEEYLEMSRISVMASDSEGLPFAIVEAMASGVVPVSTNVGAIENVIQDEENGLLVDRGNVDMLVEKLDNLLSNPQFYKTLRENLLKQREDLGYSHAQEVWGDWLTSLQVDNGL